MTSQDIIKSYFSLSGSKKGKLIRDIHDSEDFLATVFYYIDLYLWLSASKKAKNFINILEHFLKYHPKDEYRFQIIQKKAAIYESTSNYTKAFRTYLHLYESSYNMGNEGYLPKALMKNAAFLERLSKLKKIPPGIKKALPGAQQSSKSILNKALSYFTEAEFLFALSEHKYNQLAAGFNIAFINYILGRKEEAFNSCIAIIEADKISLYPSLCANVHLLLANIYEEKENKLMSKIYYEKALTDFQTSGNQLKESEILHKLAWLLVRQKKVMQAEKIYKRALDLKLSIDYRQSLGEFYFNRALVLKECGAKDKAAAFFERALFISDLTGDSGTSLYIKFQLFELLENKSNLYTLAEFIKDYKPPLSKELLRIPDRQSYHLRHGEVSSLRPYNLPETSFKIDRRIMRNMFAELTHIFKNSSDKSRFTHFLKQYTVLSSDLKAGSQ